MTVNVSSENVSNQSNSEEGAIYTDLKMTCSFLFLPLIREF